jgi:hypothetical protein
MRMDDGTTGPASYPRSLVDQPLRTRERAAMDCARAALRKIAADRLFLAGEEDLREVAVQTLERMSVILGEREAR